MNPTTSNWKYFTQYPGACNINVMASDLGEYTVLFGGYQVCESNAFSEKYFTAKETWKLE